jgi:hypothetical protein
VNVHPQFGPTPAGFQPGMPGAFNPRHPVAVAPVQDKNNLTHLDLSGTMAPVQGSGGLRIQFFYARVWVQPLDLPGEWDTRLCVAKAIKGDARSIAVTEISPELAAWQFPDDWATFTATEALPAQGTPMQELPGLTQSQLAYLALYHVRTIEDLAELGSERAGQLGLEVAHAYRKAVGWLERAHGNAALIDAATRDLATERELDRLRQRDVERDREMIELRAMVKAQAAMGGAAVPAAMAGPLAVDGEPIRVREGVQDPFAVGSTGSVSGNDDLGGDAADDGLDGLPPDPLAAAPRGRRR